MTDIIVALLGLIGIVVTAVYGAKRAKKQEHRAEQAEKEITFQKAALDFGAFIQEWSGTHNEIEHLLNTTDIDRFIIFRAWNGRLHPRWTTAVFQMRRGEQEPISYVHFELDADYVAKLKEIYLSNTIALSVDDLEDSAIKRVYNAEGVKHAVWAHLSSEQVIGGDAVSHTYCSFASHSDKPLDEATITKCAIVAGRLKGVATAFST